MSYRFVFDLSNAKEELFTKIRDFSLKKGFHRKASLAARKIVKSLNLEKLTGLPLAQIIEVVEDILEIQRSNIEAREKFVKTRKRALLLPHCARKYMDSRCKARFDGLSYVCAECSKTCLVRKAKKLAEKKGYDVFILPGGSMVEKIVRMGYDGILGVACPSEIKLALKKLRKYRVAVQALPLLRNGCSKTVFDLCALKEML